MSPVQVKKVAAICFLEAVKTTLEHLGAHRLELSGQGVVAADMTRVYGDVRRLRDYVQRCVSGYADPVDLDMAPGDVGVLVACCRYYFDVLDGRLADKMLSAEERHWLQKKQESVGDWAVELASKPLVELPLRRPYHTPSEAYRKLAARLHQKLFGDERGSGRIVPSGTGTMVGLPSFGDQVHDMTPPPNESSAEIETRPAPAFGLPRASVSFAEDKGAAAPLLDNHKLAEPRLRALVAVDQRSYARAVAASDHRLATVLMASVLEAALIDHVLPRRHDFGLTGSPDAWNMQELLLKALGEQAVPRDRSLAYHLFASRNLLRPAVQVVAPTVVTAASFDVLRDFVQRVLHGLGFGAPAAGAPAAAAPAAADAGAKKAETP